MKYALCTISFRHQLISFAEIVQFAQRHRFDGIELWGAHAENLYDFAREATWDQLRRLQGGGMRISMISDYLDISSEQAFPDTLRRCAKLIEVAKWFGASRLRTFAGHKSSAEVPPLERRHYAMRLRKVCDLCREHGVYLLIETHPGTLTDTLQSTLTLLSEVGHEQLKINLDFLHLWETGTDPVYSYHLLEPWVHNFHLKNIASPAHLDVFQPNNIFSSSGSRDGLVSLCEGAIDYEAIIREIDDSEHFASLEWFGAAPFHMLRNEIQWLRHSKIEEA